MSQKSNGYSTDLIQSLFNVKETYKEYIELLKFEINSSHKR